MAQAGSGASYCFELFRRAIVERNEHCWALMPEKQVSIRLYIREGAYGLRITARARGHGLVGLSG